ncbi:hypothetical protein A2U01_0069150 [Trifolium medium]|uniref:Uncharacterized protein n=1 Tax=Trifolium medium TaxID=97028 RepID=A0A392SG82_9FABA|nr:hypothetical protein [Trifolium medium]
MKSVRSKNEEPRIGKKNEIGKDASLSERRGGREAAESVADGFE